MSRIKFSKAKPYTAGKKGGVSIITKSKSEAKKYRKYLEGQYPELPKSAFYGPRRIR